MMNEGPATESGPAEITLMWQTAPRTCPSPISAWAKAEAASRLRNSHPHPCGGQTLPENLQPSPVDALRQAWQDGAAMNESEKQFSFTRAAPITSGPAKNQIPMCSLRSLTCLQVQVLPRQGMVGPSSHSRLWMGETPPGASSAVNGRASRWRKLPARTGQPL